jgi:hypothetical protein
MLQRSRPEAPEALVESIAARVQRTARRPMLFAPSRVFALVLTLAMFGALASFGGISYAASAAHQTVRVVKRVAAPNPIVNAVQTPAQRQYGNPGKPPGCRKNQVRVDGKCVPKCKSNQRRVNGKCARRGGVKGATKTIISSGVLGASATIKGASATSSSGSGDLPFTGFELMLVIGGGLLLVLVGGALRRFSVNRQ